MPKASKAQKLSSKPYQRSITPNSLYEFDETLAKSHIFCISKARCSFYDTVVRSMAHEMIHCSRHKSGKWTLHDATFKRRKMLVGQCLGFDGHEL